MVRVVAAVATAACGAVVAFDSSTLASRGWWQPPTQLVFWCIVVVGLSVVWQLIDAEIERRRLRRRTELANEISRLMFPFWYATRTVTNDRATRERIGVHVWMVPTWHWNVIPEPMRELVPQPIRDRLPTPKMWRACHFRLKHGEHDATDIRWSRDVGAIGRCWRERMKQHFVLNEIWGTQILDRAQWDALNDQDRLGLSHSQYARIHAKYHSVLVIPIRKHTDVPGSSFIGCVVIDSLAGYPVDLDIHRVKSKAFRAARQISDRVTPIAS